MPIRQSVGVRRSSDGRGWVFVHPRGARERAEDLEEVREMIEAGETDVAIDELRWLVERLQRIHRGPRAVGRAGTGRGRLRARPRTLRLRGAARPQGAPAGEGELARSPYSQPANRAFYEAGRGLATSLVKLGMTEKAVDLVEDLVRLDPSDPLKLRALFDEARTGGLPIVELAPAPPKSEDASYGQLREPLVRNNSPSPQPLCCSASAASSRRVAALRSV